MKNGFALGALAVLGVVGAASAEPVRSVRPAGQGSHTYNGTRTETIADQPWDGISYGYVAQDFSDFPSFSSYQFDDVVFSKDYYVETLFAPGSEFGFSGANTDVIGQIWSDLPDKGGVLLAEGHGTQVGSDLVIDFGGAQVNAGSHWITAWVERSFGAGGQWFWLSTTPVTGSEEYFYNPGGGFGFGTASIPGSVVFGVAHDMAFTLTGTPVPAPGAAALLGLGGLVALRRRR